MKTNERDPNDKSRYIRRKYWICCLRESPTRKKVGEYRLKREPSEGDSCVGGEGEWVESIALETWQETWTDGENYD